VLHRRLERRYACGISSLRLDVHRWKENLHTPCCYWLVATAASFCKTGKFLRSLYLFSICLFEKYLWQTKFINFFLTTQCCTIQAKPTHLPNGVTFDFLLLENWCQTWNPNFSAEKMEVPTFVNKRNHCSLLIFKDMNIWTSWHPWLGLLFHQIPLVPLYRSPHQRAEKQINESRTILNWYRDKHLKPVNPPFLPSVHLFDYGSNTVNAMIRNNFA